MLSSYFKIAFRNISRNKFMSSLNILGLAVGLSASLIIYLIVQHQLSFDKHYTDGDRIYRVVTHLRFAETDFMNSGVPAPLAPAVRKDVTGIDKSSAVLSILYNAKVSVERKNGSGKSDFKNQEKISFVDEDFFTMFNKKLVAGTWKGMNVEPLAVVLSASRAKQYFPGVTPAEVIGSPIFYNDTIQMRVVGVIADNDKQTDLVQEELISLPSLKAAGFTDYYNADEWGSVSSNTELYIKLAEGTQPAATQKQLQAVLNTNKKPEPGVDPKKNFSKLILQPLADVHFNQSYGGSADMSTLKGLMALAAFLLILGCINFINLSTAQAAKRAKEIGIRKTVGSTRQQLVRQFLGETFLLTVIASLFAIVLTPLLMKVFKDFIPDGLTFGITARNRVLIFIPLLIIIVTFLAGFYPAMILSRFKPVLVLKNQAYANTGQSRSAWLRKTLTVSQFIIAQFFIIATLVVGRQIHYSINMDMGFRKDNIVSVPVPRNFYKPDGKIDVLYSEILQIPGIQLLSKGDKPAISGSMSSTYKFDRQGKEVELNVQIRNGDSNFLKLFQIPLVAGRNLTIADSLNALLINEMCAKEIGYVNPADAVGNYVGKGKEKVLIAGVMKDFNLTSSKSGILPMALRGNPRVYGALQVKLKADIAGQSSQQKTIQAIEKSFKKIYPEQEFTYTYFDQSIKDFYGREQQLAKLLNWSTGLAIFISCLGLLGLVIYTSNQRKKEIGIRKVLGASVTQVVNLLSKDFLKLVLIACIIAIPVAWWACNDWLQNFPFRTPLSAWIFFAGAGILLLIAFLILSVKTINAAAANPVSSLRSE